MQKMVNREQEVARMLEAVDPLPGEDANQMVQAEADRRGVEAALVRLQREEQYQLCQSLASCS